LDISSRLKYHSFYIYLFINKLNNLKSIHIGEIYPENLAYLLFTGYIQVLAASLKNKTNAENETTVEMKT